MKYIMEQTGSKTHKGCARWNDIILIDDVDRTFNEVKEMFPNSIIVMNDIKRGYSREDEVDELERWKEMFPNLDVTKSMITFPTPQKAIFIKQLQN